uniref:uncharacterized protein n=1 Tax=Dermacentor albipictus TaxID=60249 RepID=UPI0038FC0AE7
MESTAFRLHSARLNTVAGGRRGPGETEANSGCVIRHPKIPKNNCARVRERSSLPIALSEFVHQVVGEVGQNVSEQRWPWKRHTSALVKEDNQLSGFAVKAVKRISTPLARRKLTAASPPGTKPFQEDRGERTTGRERTATVLGAVECRRRRLMAKDRGEASCSGSARPGRKGANSGSAEKHEVVESTAFRLPSARLSEFVHQVVGKVGQNVSEQRWPWKRHTSALVKEDDQL